MVVRVKVCAVVFSIHWRINIIIEKIALLQRLTRGGFSKPSSSAFDFEFLSTITTHFFSSWVILIVSFENLAYMMPLKPFVFSIICITSRWLWEIQWEEGARELIDSFDYLSWLNNLIDGVDCLVRLLQLIIVIEFWS